MNVGTRCVAAGRFVLRVPQRALIGAVMFYRLFFSAWVGNVCRYEPSCSSYALQALERHGAWRGAGLAGWRLLRCHPWCVGGADPVPPAAHAGHGLFTRLLEPGPAAQRPIDGRERPLPHESIT